MAAYLTKLSRQRHYNTWWLKTVLLAVQFLVASSRTFGQVFLFAWRERKINFQARWYSTTTSKSAQV